MFTEEQQEALKELADQRVADNKAAADRQAAIDAAEEVEETTTDN